MPQWVAVALAAAGVANQILAVGELPWIALVLAGSFSLYGLLRKTLAVSALPGLFVEAAVLAPVALVYMAWVISSRLLKKSVKWDRQIDPGVLRCSQHF